MVNFIFKVYLFRKRRAIILYMLLHKLREGAIPQLLLKTPGHPWHRVPTENHRHRRPCLGAFIFGVSATSGVLSSAPRNVQVVCECVDRCGGALVSCFGLQEGAGKVRA